MQAAVGIPVDIVTVIQALIVIFIAAPRLVREVFHLPAPRQLNLPGAYSSLVVAVSAARPTRIPRYITAGALEIVLGLVGLVVFAFGSRSTEKASFQFSLPGATFDVGTLTFKQDDE